LGVAIRVFEDDGDLAQVIKDMIKELSERFAFRFDGLWFVVTSEEDILSKEA
jgi:hypothetical protein